MKSELTKESKKLISLVENEIVNYLTNLEFLAYSNARFPRTDVIRMLDDVTFRPNLLVGTSYRKLSVPSEVVNLVEVYSPFIEDIAGPEGVKREIKIFKDPIDRWIKKTTPISVTKLLRLAGVVSNEEIKEFANIIYIENDLLPVKLKITNDPDTIEHVYTKGPHSCMKYKWDKHPSRVYASPDCAVAYLEESSGRITARAVLNTKNHKYLKIYGNNALKMLLEADGYEQGNLFGCRLAMVQVDEDEYRMPWLDKSASCIEQIIHDDEGVWFKAGYDGLDTQVDEITAEPRIRVFSNGLLDYAETLTTTCDDCGDDVQEESITYLDYYDTYICDHCLDVDYVYSDPEGLMIRLEDGIEFQGAWYAIEYLDYYDLIIYNDEVMTIEDYYNIIKEEEEWDETG